MALHPLEYDYLKSLYRKTDKVQKDHFVKWISSQAPAEKPASLRSVEEHLAARSGVPVCPRCGGSHVVKNGKHNGRQRFVCKDCKKTIGLSRGSLYFSGKKPFLAWQNFVRDLEARKSLRECARRCNISLTTAVAWKRKYLADLVRSRLCKTRLG